MIAAQDALIWWALVVACSCVWGEMGNILRKDHVYNLF